MSKSQYHGANVELSQPFHSLVVRANEISYDMATIVVTAIPYHQPDMITGGMTEGNAHVQGIFSSNVLTATQALRGGTVSVPANLSLVSNVIFDNSPLVHIKSTTANVQIDSTTLNVTSNLRVNSPGRVVTVSAANTTFSSGAVYFGANTHTTAPLATWNVPTVTANVNTMAITAAANVVFDSPIIRIGSAGSQFLDVNMRTSFDANTTQNGALYTVNANTVFTPAEVTVENNINLGADNTANIVTVGYFTQSLIPRTTSVNLGNVTNRYGRLDVLHVQSNTITNGGISTFNGAMTVNSTANVTGIFTAHSHSQHQSTLSVVGAANFSNTLSVIGSANLSNTLTVAGLTTINNNLSVKPGDLTDLTVSNTSGNLKIAMAGSNNQIASNILDITDILGTKRAIFSNVHGGVQLLHSGTVRAQTQSTGFAVTGNASVSSNMTVSGTTQLTGAVNGSNTLTIAGHSTFNSSSTFNGAVNANNVVSIIPSSNNSVNTIFDAVGLNPRIKSTGALVLESNDGFNLRIDQTKLADYTSSKQTFYASNVEVATVESGIFTVIGGTNTNTLTSGVSTLGNTSIIGGLSVSQNMSVSGSSQQTGAVAMSNTLTVSGITYLNNAGVSTSHSTGAVRIVGGLGVGGNIFTNGSLNTTKTLSVDQTSVLTGNVTAGANVSIAGDLSVSGGIYPANVGTSRIGYFDTSGKLVSSANLTFNGTSAGLSGALNITGTQTTSGLSTFNGNVNATATINSTGILNANVLNVSGVSTLSGALIADSTANFNDVVTIKPSANTSVTTVFDAINESSRISLKGNSILNGGQSIKIQTNIGANTFDNLLVTPTTATFRSSNTIVATITQSGITTTANVQAATVIATNSSLGVANASALAVSGATSLNSTLTVSGLSSVANLNTTGVVYVGNSTESTNTSTGAITVLGGLGVAKRINAQGDASFESNVAIGNHLSVNGGFTVNSESITLPSTWVGANHITFTNANRAIVSSNKLTFTDSTGVLSLTGNLSVSGSTTFSGPSVLNGTTTANTLNATGIVSLTSTSPSTSKTTGALRISGGLGVSGAMFGSAATFDSINCLGTASTSSLNASSVAVSGTATIASAAVNIISVSGLSNFTNNTNASNLTSAAIIVEGGQAIKKNLIVGGETYLEGDVYINGQAYFNSNVELILNSSTASQLRVTNTLTMSPLAYVNSDFTPLTSDQFKLGTSSNKWLEVNASTLTGNINWSYVTSKPSPVITLTGDASGNATLSNLSSASLAVTIQNASATGKGLLTNTDQTIAGVKTFISTISGSINGNAGTATALQNARTINGTSFNGTANINLTTTNIAALGSTAGSYPILVVDNATAGLKTIMSSAGVTINPSDNTVSATNINSSSDVRLKHDIVTIREGLEKVKALRGVMFKRYDSGERDYMGVIAQETEAVIPEVVHTGTDGFKTVSYGNIVGLLIEAIKDLSDKIDDIEKKLK